MTDSPEKPAEAAPAKTPAERMAIARAARAAKAPAKPEAEKPAEAAGESEPAANPPSVPEPTILERVAINAEDARQRKIDALRKAKAGRNDSIGEPLVEVRVLKRGAGQISMGEHVPGLGELTYDAGETPNFPKSVAEELENRGLVEIQ